MIFFDRSIAAALLAAFAVACLPLTASAGDSPQVIRGAAIYRETCQLCHGADGQRGEGTQTPIWGAGAQLRKFEHGQGLFEYMQFLMPFDNPNKITEEQKWDVIAYLLVNHGAMARSGTIDPGRASSIAIK